MTAPNSWVTGRSWKAHEACHGACVERLVNSQKKRVERQAEPALRAGTSSAVNAMRYPSQGRRDLSKGTQHRCVSCRVARIALHTKKNKFKHSLLAMLLTEMAASEQGDLDLSETHDICVLAHPLRELRIIKQFPGEVELPQVRRQAPQPPLQRKQLGNRMHRQLCFPINPQSCKNGGFDVPSHRRSGASSADSADKHLGLVSRRRQNSVRHVDT